MKFSFPMIAALAVAGAASAQEAEVLHYWTSGSEAAALATIADSYKAKGGTWTDQAVGGFDAERTIAMTRFAGGNPPAAMLTELGQETRSLAEAGVLRPITDIYESKGWTEVLAPTVLAALTVDDDYYAVPVDVGGRNWLWVNTAVFEAAGVEIPQTWDEFWPAAEAIAEAGYIPFALGGEGWQIDLVFTAVMAGVGGNDFFKAIYEQASVEAAESETMLKVFETMRRLSQMVDEDSPNRAWNETTALVVNGEAGMLIMGDWAKGEFLGAGMTPGEDFECVLAPDTQDFYDAIVDAFVFPDVGDDALAGQDLLLETMMDPEVQVAFNKLKGSLPPRSDADLSSMDLCAQRGAEAMADPETYIPAVVNRPTNDVAGQLEDIVSEFWNTPDMSAEDAAALYADVLASR